MKYVWITRVLVSPGVSTVTCDGLPGAECVGQTSVPGVCSPFHLIILASISGMNSCPTFSTSAQLEHKEVDVSGAYGASYCFPSGFNTALVMAYVWAFPPILSHSCFPKSVCTSTILYVQVCWLPLTYGQSLPIPVRLEQTGERFLIALQGAWLLNFRLFLTSETVQVQKC